ncbi:MAG: TSUP family transporter [Saprospiraceae bacterium]|nr:TSUP family transporter [Saprospiraceae bacterium]
MNDLLILCLFAFLAGFIDSIVGGGGLIQTPALLITMPQMAVPMLMGTAKISSIAGSTMSSIQYARQVTFQKKTLTITIVAAIIGAFLGARLINYLQPTVVKPSIFFLLILVFVYMLLKKDFGQSLKTPIAESKAVLYSSLFGFSVGVYDGFLGPGTGSFLILFFVSAIGFDFLLASAHAKVVNLATNIGAVIYFIASNNVLWAIALPMAFCNLSGSYLGSKLAMLKGNEFIRVFFLGVILLMILRYGYDIFIK